MQLYSKANTSPKNTSRVFHVETTWKRLFLRLFNVEYTWCVCREVPSDIVFLVSLSNGRFCRAVIQSRFRHKLVKGRQDTESYPKDSLEFQCT